MGSSGLQPPGLALTASVFVPVAAGDRQKLLALALSQEKTDMSIDRQHNVGGRTTLD
jgi:hypothetical protein